VNPAQAAVASLLDDIDPADRELLDLARQILEPVEPLEYRSHPTDEGEGAWWLPADPLSGLGAPGELPADWWAGVLEGMRIGLELGRQIAAAPTPLREKPSIPGLRTR
jgi:hypothetical protein